MKNRKLKLSALLVAILVFLVGCSTNQNETVGESQTETTLETTLETAGETTLESTSETTNETTGETQSNTSSNQAGEITVEEALEIFYTTFSDNTINVTGIDYDKERGEYEYQIDGWKDNTEYELTVKAKNGEITEQRTEQDNDIDMDEAIDLQAVITPQEAIDQAKTHSNGTTVEGWDLQSDYNRISYDIEFRDGPDVELDATDGSLIELD